MEKKEKMLEELKSKYDKNNQMVGGTKQEMSN